MKNRPIYMKQLMSWKNKKIIKIITGIRRCGKSSILDLFMEQLRESGVNDNRITHINFEDLLNEKYHDYKVLHDFLQSAVVKGEMNYIILDEIQLVSSFEKVVISIYLLDNVDIYLTGSNATLLSGEIATLLAGRYIEIKLLPLSYNEYLSFKQEPQSTDESFLNYLKYGGMPYVTELALNQKNIYDYLKGIFDTVVIKDVVVRNNIKDVQTLYSVVNFLFDNISNTTSVNKISNTLSSNGKKTTAVTVANYVKYLEDAFIISKVKRYDIKGKSYLKTQEKYYITDIGLRNAVLGLRDVDQGHIIENVVYLELIRKGYVVSIGKLRDSVIDFIAVNQNTKIYIQVALSVVEDTTLQRELGPLKKLRDDYQKVLITSDKLLNNDFDGIKHINLIDFLTNNDVI